MDVRGRVEDVCGQRRGGRDDVLAIVEDQQHPLVTEMRQQRGQGIVGLGRQTEHQQDRGDHEIGIAQRGKVDEMRGIGECFEQLVSDRHGDRGLADAAGPCNRDKARGEELVGDGGDRIVTPDHPLQPVRQLHGRQFRSRRGALGQRDIRLRNRRHEAITAAGQRRDVAGAVLAVAERLAERCDMKAQIGLFDREAGPHQRHQVPFADDLVRPRHQRHQRVERLGAERHRDAVACHEPFTRRHGEWSER